ncbi:MAG: hypothetical protein RSE56_00230 [Bacilli bacterium]
MLSGEWYNNPGMIFLFIIVIFAVIALSAFLIKKYYKPFKKEKEESEKELSEKKEEDIASEELKRILEPVDELKETEKENNEIEKK